MRLSQRILKIFHPREEGERMELREAVARASAEAEDLTRTVSMNRDEFCAMLRREAGEPAVKEVVIFDTYAAICEFRYSPKDSLMRLCRHPKHDAHATGIAACRDSLCPRLREAAKK